MITEVTTSDNYILTFSGKKFYPLNPKPEDVDIEDIAHALAMKCRFTGHTQYFYSVGDHSLRVMDILEMKYKLCGLMHDAAEAYLPDVARPVKQAWPEFKKWEDRVYDTICTRYDLPIDIPATVKYADNILLVTEARDLMSRHADGSPFWFDEEHMRKIVPLENMIVPRPHQESKSAFLNHFHYLTGYKHYKK